MSHLARLIIIALAMCAQSAWAGFCNQNASIGNAISDYWGSDCESIHHVKYNPYGSDAGYPAKFFQFELTRDADVSISLSQPHASELFLIEGNNKYATPLLSYQGSSIKTRLSAGTYIVEAVNRYTGNNTFLIEYNDIGSSTCISSINFGNTESDGWVPECESTSRDIEDPYDTIPGEGHRAKYFTFSLDQDSDIAVNIDATVDSYVYILDGHGEFGSIVEEFSGANTSKFLAAGDYTIELTTKERYAPGKFSILLNKFTNNNECEQDFTLGNSLDGTWSGNCEIRSWIDGNGDPYQGGNSPERANYYRFSLDKLSDVKFSRSPGTHTSTVMSIYNQGDYFNKVASTVPRWSSADSTLLASLPAGDYVLEVTQHNRIASGDYSISTELLDSNGCETVIGINQTKSAISSSLCNSLIRGVDGNSDSYGSQSGTYYAKRFRLTLSEATPIRIRASATQSSYMYLFKEFKGNLELVTQSWQNNYWNTTQSPYITRLLDEGTYVIEVTSHYPERDFSFDLTTEVSAGVNCESFIRLNERRSYESLNSSCQSDIKESGYNYDPYGSSGYEYYYAKSYTFEIQSEGNYRISTESNQFDSQIYLFNGGDRKSTPVADQYSFSTTNSFDTYLQPGIYTVEVTTRTPNRTGPFKLLVWDKSSEITEYHGSNSACNTSISVGTHNINGQLTSECHSEHWGNDFYALGYTFSIPDQAALNAEVFSNISTSLTLYVFNGAGWSYAAHNSGGNQTSFQTPLPSGLYKLEVHSAYSQREGSFNLKVSISKDSDGDGYGDDIDEFPNDPYEWLDTDQDLIGNNEDPDDDNDGVNDYEDRFPLDNSENKDSDGDDIGDNSDPTPYSYYGDIQFSQQNYSVSENAGHIDIPLVSVAGFFGNQVLLFTQEGSAKTGEHFKHTIAYGYLNAGEKSNSIRIPIINDSTYNGDKTFKVYFETYNDATTSLGKSATVTIKDDEAVTSLVTILNPEISVSDVNKVTEVKLERSGDISKSCQVHYRTLDGSALALQDYLPSSGIVDFAPGQATSAIPISLISSNQPQGEKSFSLELFSVENGVLDNSSATIILAGKTSSKPHYKFIYSDVKVAKDKYSFDARIVRSNTVGDATVSFKAESSENDTIAFGTTQFNDGEKYKNITVNGLFFNQYTPFIKTITLTLLNASGEAQVSSKPLHLSIWDNSYFPWNGILIADGHEQVVKEGETETVLINQLSFKDNLVDVDIQTLGSSADNSTDFTPVSESFRTSREDTSHELSVEILEDDQWEGNEQLAILANGRPLTSIIIDDSQDLNGRGYPSFSSKQIVLQEGESREIAIQRLLGNKGILTIQLNTRDGDALVDKHYNLVSQTIDILDGQSNSSVTLAAKGLQGEEAKHYYLDMVAEYENGTKINESLRVDIVQGVSSSSKKDDKGILGLGSFNPLILVILALLLLVRRIRFIPKSNSAEQ